MAAHGRRTASSPPSADYTIR